MTCIYFFKWCSFCCFFFPMVWFGFKSYYNEMVPFSLWCGLRSQKTIENYGKTKYHRHKQFQEQKLQKHCIDCNSGRKQWIKEWNNHIKMDKDDPTITTSLLPKKGQTNLQSLRWGMHGLISLMKRELD